MNDLYQSILPTRRKVVGAIAATPLSWHMSDSFSQAAGPLKICQSIALTGPLGDLGQAMRQGAIAYFANVNDRGGIFGRAIELVSVDDGYDVRRALANVQDFLADPKCFALFNCMGTPMIEAMLPQVVASGIPFFAPFSGALTTRPKNARNVFSIRASYSEEGEKLVRHLATIGIKRIGIAYQKNSFGREVYEGVQSAMGRYKLTASMAIAVESNGGNAGSAASTLAAGNPEAVLVGLAGKPAIEFIKAIRFQRRGLPLYALSILGAADALHTLGDDAVGLTMSQVVPTPGHGVVPVVREFESAWQASHAPMQVSHVALEGYINARVFAEAARRAGRNLGRNDFIETIWNLKKFDLGGFQVSFNEPGEGASHYVELTMVGHDGRFIR